MPSYEVLVTAYCTVVVQDVENEEEAIDVVWNEVNRGDFELDDCRVEQELSSEEDLERAVRHCNQVI